MTPKNSDNTDAALDDLLQELSFAPPDALNITHQAPAGLQQRILASVYGEQQNPVQPTTLSWLFSPWRGFAASAATLLFGVVLGSSTAATEFYTATIETTIYPDNDQLLVIESLDDDFTNILGAELIQDWDTADGAGSATHHLQGEAP